MAWLRPTKARISAPTTSWQPSHAKVQSKASFLDLPRELRDEIYRYTVILENGAVDLSQAYDFDEPHSSESEYYYSDFKNMRAVCRQTKTEVEKMFYKYNSFQIDLRYDECNHWSIPHGVDCFYCHVLGKIKKITCDYWPFSMPEYAVQLVLSQDSVTGVWKYECNNSDQGDGHYLLGGDRLPMATTESVNNMFSYKLPHHEGLDLADLTRIRDLLTEAVYRLTRGEWTNRR